MSAAPRAGLWFICCRSPRAMAAARAMAFENGADIAPLAPSDWGDLKTLGAAISDAAVATDAEAALPNDHGLTVATVAPRTTTARPDRLGDVWLRTSGSTGKPRLVRREAAALAADAERAVKRLADGLPSASSFVATVPFEHMFGYTYALQLSEALGLPIQDTRPVMPGDLRKAIDEAGGSAWLVTTPTHLRSYALMPGRFSGVAGLIVATSPLDAELARASCTVFDAPILENYGSTETGGVASRLWRRDAAQAPKWRPLPGASLTTDKAGRAVWTLDGMPTPITLDDLVQIDDDGFLLLGRTDDTVKIAGKRGTLGGLTAQLTALACVRDGIYLKWPNEGREALGALVVPDRGDRHPAEILDTLAGVVDPVFLPKRIALVDALPRTDTGKLRRDDGLALLATHGLSRHSLSRPK